jgi:hypothetical protein
MTVSQTVSAEVPNSLGLIVENLTEGETSCGVTTEGLKAATFSAMRYNRIEMIQSGKPFAYISVNTLHFPDGLCVASYNVSIRQWQYATPVGTDKAIMASTTFCEKGGMISRMRNAGTAINDAIKSSFDRCIADMVD